MRLLFLLLLLWGVCTPVQAQLAAEARVTGTGPVAAFTEARALAADPFGRLYVADAGRDVIVLLTPEGAPVATLGGPGSGEGEFDAPADMDPTNGLVLYVADAGNGRVQHFSRAMAFLGALPVGEGAPGPAYGREGRFGTSAEGRPVSVAAAGTGELFVLDEEAGVVRKWDAQRRTMQEVGGYGAGAGALVDPVALAVDPEGLLYVIDRGTESIRSYDLFGGYVRAFAQGPAAEARALFLHDDRLWLVLPDRLLAYTLEGRLDRVVAVDLPEPLVDAARVGDRLFLLTRTGLFEGK